MIKKSIIIIRKYFCLKKFASLSWKKKENYRKPFYFALMFKKVLSQQTKNVNRNIRTFRVSGFASSSLKYKKFFKLREQFFEEEFWRKKIE